MGWGPPGPWVFGGKRHSPLYAIWPYIYMYIYLNAIDISLYCDRSYGGGRSGEHVAVSPVVVRVYVKPKYGQRKALRGC